VYRSIAWTTDNRFVTGLTPQELINSSVLWYWIDFDAPTAQEKALLREVFLFHPVAVENCFHATQRPKVDRYKDFEFLVLYSIDQKTLDKKEVNVFIDEKSLVTIHKEENESINELWVKVEREGSGKSLDAAKLMYWLLEQMVHEYFPPIYQMEDRLIEISAHDTNKTYAGLIDEVFSIRNNLLQMRRTVIPMRDLLYQLLYLETFHYVEKHKTYFRDIYDHLLKAVELVEANREMTSDLRDSYQTLSSNRMNAVMVTLTIVSTVFIPLTFLTGVYGMNFANMPELTFRYGYFALLAFMIMISFLMLWQFKRRGWFDIFK
jgi:magnesium transporter